jgi:PBSX family phage terminase large subunit
MKLNEKQKKAVDLIRNYRNVFLYGGARSGKTFIFVMSLVIRALKHPKSRHIILRKHFKHIKKSIWMETIPAVLSVLSIPATIYQKYESDLFIRFYNGAEIWCDGLDDKIRVEKILGREYNTIYFNEISEIPYDTVETVQTRLSYKVPGCSNRLWYDCNPPGTTHWSYKLFVKGLHPLKSTPVRTEYYRNLQMNPQDNAENIDDEFLETLRNLSEEKQRRFLHGEFSDPENQVFKNWQIIESLPDGLKRRRLGLDFGFSVDPCAMVECYLDGNNLYINELLYETGLPTSGLISELKAMDITDVLWCDSAELRTIDEIQRAGIPAQPVKKGPDSIRHGVEWLQGKKIYITASSTNIITEFENYSHKKDRNGVNIAGKYSDNFNHAIDAIRYACEQDATEDRPKIYLI